jgi:chemotaxis protein CheD
MKPDFKGLPSVYIHPGEACFSSNPIVVSTVLGSCLSVTMFSGKIKYAGISHCQLPYCRKTGQDCNDCKDPYKFVNCTIVQMIRKFEKLQIPRKEIEVKIFGGADVLKTFSGERREPTIGRQNIQSALETLDRNNMSASVSDVAGIQGRKIIFFTETGEIFLNRMKYNE